MDFVITLITILALYKPNKMHATAYCDYGYTASGEYVAEGICATGDKSHIGETAWVFQRLPNEKQGKLIGIYSVKDCGCRDTVVDIWCPDLEGCQEFMDIVYEDGCKGKVFVYFTEGEEIGREDFKQRISNETGG